MVLKTRSEAAKGAHMVRRILEVAEKCSATEIRQGREWYGRAETAAIGMGFDLVRSAGVISALSPRTQWATNLSWARQVLIAAVEYPEGAIPAVHTTTMRLQAWRIANGEHPLTVLKGPKVRAFFANITGDHEAVTVDVWAARIAEGWTAPQPDATSRVTRNRNKVGARAKPDSIAGRRYVLIADAYRAAAAKITTGGGPRISPRDLQAAVWVHVRGAAS